MSKLPTAKDLAPVAAVLDPAYPELLREATEILFLQLVDEEASPPDEPRSLRLAQIALAQVERLSEVIGGGAPYWPKAVRFRLTPRNRQMCSEFRGDYKPLARKYKLTEQQVRNIVDEWQREQFARKQSPLFAESVGVSDAAKTQGKK